MNRDIILNELFNNADIIEKYKLQYNNTNRLNDINFDIDNYNDILSKYLKRSDKLIKKNLFKDFDEKFTIEKFNNNNLFTQKYVNFPNNATFYNNKEFNSKKKDLFKQGTREIKGFNNEITFSRYDPDIYVNYEDIVDSNIANYTIFIDPLKFHTINFKKGIYDYKDIEESEEINLEMSDPYNVWVDFANPFLGGGIFGSGYVQEEIMFLQIPQLAAIAFAKGARKDHSLYSTNYNYVKPFLTRYQKPKMHNPLNITQAKPTPIIIKNVVRVLETMGYRRDGLTKSNPYYKILNNPQRGINVLAVSAPNTRKLKNYNKYSVEVMLDILNTLIIGFEHVYLTSESHDIIIINSGKVGSGDYGNDYRVVGVLHYLAQEYVNQVFNTNIKVNLWAYGYNEKTETQNLLNNLINELDYDTANYKIIDIANKLHNILT